MFQIIGDLQHIRIWKKKKAVRLSRWDSKSSLIIRIKTNPECTIAVFKKSLIPFINLKLLKIFYFKLLLMKLLFSLEIFWRTRSSIFYPLTENTTSSYRKLENTFIVLFKDQNINFNKYINEVYVFHESSLIFLFILEEIKYKSSK